MLQSTNELNRNFSVGDNLNEGVDVGFSLGEEQKRKLKPISEINTNEENLLNLLWSIQKGFFRIISSA